MGDITFSIASGPANYDRTRGSKQADCQDPEARADQIETRFDVGVGGASACVFSSGMGVAAELDGRLVSAPRDRPAFPSDRRSRFSARISFDHRVPSNQAESQIDSAMLNLGLTPETGMARTSTREASTGTRRCLLSAIQNVPHGGFAGALRAAAATSSTGEFEADDRAFRPGPATASANARARTRPSTRPDPIARLAGEGCSRAARAGRRQPYSPAESARRLDDPL